MLFMEWSHHIKHKDFVIFTLKLELWTICRLYKVIHKSLRDFRPLRYSSRDGHAEGEHVNKGRNTPSFFPTLQVLDMCTLGDAADVNPVIKFLRHALQRVSQELARSHERKISIQGVMPQTILSCLL
jgi:hypothetical protein